MLLTSDQYKITMSRLGELRSRIQGLTGNRSKAIATLITDVNHSDLWKAGQREELEKAFNQAMEKAMEEAKELQRYAITAEVRASDPVMAVFGHRVPGALTLEGDASAKAEFRAMMQGLPTSSRRTWLDALVGEKDWGRVGVLLSLDPTLAADAKGLDIPGRDEALKNAAELRNLASSIIAAEEERKCDERIEELNRKANLTPGEGMELVMLGNRKATGWKVNQSASAEGMSPTESARYAGLNAKAESGEELTKAEGVELVNLARKLENA